MKKKKKMKKMENKKRDFQKLFFFHFFQLYTRIIHYIKIKNHGLTRSIYQNVAGF